MQKFLYRLWVCHSMVFMLGLRSLMKMHQMWGKPLSAIRPQIKQPQTKLTQKWQPQEKVLPGTRYCIVDARCDARQVWKCPRKYCLDWLIPFHIVRRIFYFIHSINCRFCFSGCDATVVMPWWCFCFTKRLESSPRQLGSHGSHKYTGLGKKNLLISALFKIWDVWNL